MKHYPHQKDCLGVAYLYTSVLWARIRHVIYVQYGSSGIEDAEALPLVHTGRSQEKDQSLSRELLP